MLYKKEGFPEEDELVLCTVTKIQYHSVFCHLDEYEKSGMIHISEIAPGRIRNIRDYVQEGKKVVCQVLDIDKEKGHIDLSLRRVSEAQTRAKQQMIKQEKQAEKIIDKLADELNREPEELYEEIADAIFEKYDMLYQAFEDVVENDANLAGTGLDEEIAETLTEIVKDKIKPKEVTISGDLTAKSYVGNGLQVIKEALSEAEKQGEGCEITYIGAGKYKVKVTASDYKEAESQLDECVTKAKTVIEENKGEASFKRKE